MHHALNEEILSGIKAYLRQHFPDVEFTAKGDPKTDSVILQGNGRPRYRLEITERFLDGEEGAVKSLEQVQQWTVAEALREARSKLVTLATTGLHTKAHPHALHRPPRKS